MLEGLPGSTEVRRAFSAGDSGGAVAAGVQGVRLAAGGPVRREDGGWSGRAEGMEGRAGFRRHLEHRFHYPLCQALFNKETPMSEGRLSS